MIRLNIWICSGKPKVRVALVRSSSPMLTTLGFDEFIREREMTRVEDPSVRIFDQIILSKKNRGRTSFFGKSSIDFLSDVSDHLWRTAAAAPPSGSVPGDYMKTTSRSMSMQKSCY
jgi:hypothetical protein